MGINKRIYSDYKNKLNFKEWVQIVSGWKNKFDLSHVEFHQKEFHPGNKDISIYGFEFHFQSNKAKYILNGLCNVTWADKLNLYGNYIPEILDVEQFQILEYSGKDKFELAQVIGAEGDKSFSGPGMPLSLIHI